MISAVAASPASGGGIADEPCPNAAGEHTNTCPAATIGEPYSIRFRETEGSGCGPGRQTFHLDSGGLPPGLALSPSGTLSGTPGVAGRYRFYVQMREPADDPASCAGKRTEKQFTLWVRRPLSLTARAPLPRSEVGVPLRVALRARGGSGVFAWIAPAKLPPGLRLRGSSVVGTPRAAGTVELSARVRDTEARVAEWRGALRVAPRVALPEQRLPVARVGRRYRAGLRVEGGVAPHAWSLVAGRLPRGLGLLRGGRLAGTPAEAGRYPVTVRVRDALGAAALAPLTIVVRAS